MSPAFTQTAPSRSCRVRSQSQRGPAPTGACQRPGGPRRSCSARRISRRHRQCPRRPTPAARVSIARGPWADLSMPGARLAPGPRSGHGWARTIRQPLIALTARQLSLTRGCGMPGGPLRDQQASCSRRVRARTLASVGSPSGTTRPRPT
jgi:hypothetical protein